jgi:hypothetical protein
VTHATQTFNADFYATCATVIPLLFLTLALPAERLESGWRRYHKGHRGDAIASFRILQVLATSAGAIGEFFTLDCLWEREALYGPAPFILTVFLLLCVAIAINTSLHPAALDPEGEQSTPKGESSS